MSDAMVYEQLKELRGEIENLKAKVRRIDTALVIEHIQNSAVGEIPPSVVEQVQRILRAGLGVFLQPWRDSDGCFFLRFENEPQRRKAPEHEVRFFQTEEKADSEVENLEQEGGEISDGDLTVRLQAFLESFHDALTRNQARAVKFAPHLTPDEIMERAIQKFRQGLCITVK